MKKETNIKRINKIKIEGKRIEENRKKNLKLKKNKSRERKTF